MQADINSSTLTTRLTDQILARPQYTLVFTNMWSLIQIRSLTAWRLFEGAKLLVFLSDSINGAPEGVSNIWVAFHDTSQVLIRVRWGLQVCLIKEYL